MNTTIRIVVLIMVLGISNAFAQDYKGIATYKTQHAVDFKLDSTNNPNMTRDMQKQMQAMLKKQFQKTYRLSFDKSTSIYKEEENLAAPQVGNSNMQIEVIGSGGADILFKNTKNNTYTDQKDTMGKIFLVKDDIKKINWKLEKETKFIGKYQCFKATYIKMIPKPKNFSEYNKNKEEDKEVEKVERIVTAWYTLQIPVNNGPAMYQGLPGLILQVNDGKLNIVCSQIVINPKQKVIINAPKKGKEVNQKEYDKIREKKQKEMLERYAPRKGNRKKEGIEIRFGGK